jgi:hypothetical protein
MATTETISDWIYNSATTQGGYTQNKSGIVAEQLAKQACLNYILANSDRARSDGRDVVTSRVIRPEITVNKMDESGWRKPSPYSMSWWNSLVIERGAYNANWICGKSYPYGYWNGPLQSARYWVGVNQGPAWIVAPEPSAAYWPGPSSNTENALLASALSQAKDQTLNLAMNVLEARESFKTLASIIKKISAIILAIRKKDVSELHKQFGFKTKHYNSVTKTYTKDAGSLWLEALYGIRPLILDCYNLAEFLEKELRGKDFLLVARSRKTEEMSANWTHPTGPDRGYDHVWTGGIESTQKVALWYVLKGEDLHLASSLGLTNPLLWAWELTTLSFVVDWLIPVGDVLSALDSDLGFQFKGGSHTYFSEFKGFCEFTDFPKLTTASINNTQLQELHQEVRVSDIVTAGKMQRKVYTTSPKPSLYIKDPFSVAHVITTVALVSGKTPLRKRR